MSRLIFPVYKRNHLHKKNVPHQDYRQTAFKAGVKIHLKVFNSPLRCLKRAMRGSVCSERKVQALGGADRWMDSVHTVNIFFYLPNADLIIFLQLSIFSSLNSHTIETRPSRDSFLSTIPTVWYSCPFGRARGLFPIKGRYGADQRSYKQEFQSTQQECLFLVESDDLHFFLLVFQKWGMEIFQ